MTMTAGQKGEIISKFATANGDTGSVEVQVALLTERIGELNHHFEVHKKDHASRHGWLKMVGRRRRLLGYLKKHSEERYKKLIDVLGLRK